MSKYPKIVGVCKNCQQDIIAKNHSFDKPNRTYCSMSCKTTYQNKTNNPAWREDVKKKIGANTRRHLTGRKRSKEFCENNRLVNLGDKSHFWKGGLTVSSRLIRNSAAYREWRVAVFERDNYTCVQCGARSQKGKTVVLNADHIVPFSKDETLGLMLLMVELYAFLVTYRHIWS